MKKTILFIALGVAFLLGGQNLKAQEKAIDAVASNIHWLGKKVTGQHEGNISLKSGSLTLDNGTVTGGNFIVDMTSMTCTDLKGKYAGKLIGHLSSDDFFGVATHPEAKLVFTKVTAKVIIDRSKHDIRYGSNSFFDNLGDKAIYNNFELDVILKM